MSYCFLVILPVMLGDWVLLKYFVWQAVSLLSSAPGSWPTSGDWGSSDRLTVRPVWGRCCLPGVCGCGGSAVPAGAALGGRRSFLGLDCLLPLDWVGCSAHRAKSFLSGCLLQQVLCLRVGMESVSQAGPLWWGPTAGLAFCKVLGEREVGLR